ncbi:MAG: hypothetical protein ACI81P_000430 [Neolewinella sp.]|jgi:hypothetical protein
MENRTAIVGLNIYEALLSYAEQLFRNRIEHALGETELAPLPGLQATDSRLPLAVFLNGLSAHPGHQAAVVLAMLPELDPGFLTRILATMVPKGKDLTAFGGIRGKQHRGILPTGETLQFLLGGGDLAARLASRELLSPHSPLIKANILWRLPPPPGEPMMAGQLKIDASWLDQMLTGQLAEPAFSKDFPAQRIDTSLNWEDIVLNKKTFLALTHVRHYLAHHATMDGQPGFGRYARRGYRALFYGPPGTGKTLTAGLLGKAIGRSVFRVDLSMVVSKYIGETEKNLAGLFAKAEHKGWILFFDEADALFGKRTEVKEGKDRYANQEISYLLQRVEQYDGLVILATNFRKNLDQAFTRRFEAIVPFQVPGPAERALLWEKMLPEKLPLGPEVNLEDIVVRYELSGAAIANLLRHACMEAIAAGQVTLTLPLLLAAIRREYEKGDKIFPGVDTFRK